MSRPPHSIYTERSVPYTKAGDDESDLCDRHSDDSDARPATDASACSRTAIAGDDIDDRASNDDDIDDDRTGDLGRAR